MGGLRTLRLKRSFSFVIKWHRILRTGTAGVTTEDMTLFEAGTNFRTQLSLSNCFRSSVNFTFPFLEDNLVKWTNLTFKITILLNKNFN